MWQNRVLGLDPGLNSIESSDALMVADNTDNLE